MNDSWKTLPLGEIIKWGDFWFRPYDSTWVEVGAGLVGRRTSPSTLVSRKQEHGRKWYSTVLHFLEKNRFDKLRASE